MAFRLATFNGVTLPGYNWSADLDTFRVMNPVLQTLGGAVDFLGNRRRINNEHTFQMVGMFDVGSVTLPQDIRFLKRQVGQTGNLIRVHTDASNTLQRYCRLLHVGHPIRSNQRGLANVLPLTFWTNQPFWRSAATTSHGPTGLAAGVNNIAYTIAGEEHVLDAVLTITATSSISSIIISHTKTEAGVSITSDLRYATTLTAGNALVLNCGLYTATVGGSGALSGFSEGVNHTEIYWLRLVPGANTFTITLGSGAGNVSLSYNQQFQ
jgi:hypothetical protein